MSFVDVMGNVRWTPEDLSARAQRIVKQYYSARRTRDLDDMLAGATAGMYVLSPEEQADIAAYKDLRLEARQALQDAQADWAVLEEVLAVEDSRRSGEVLAGEEVFSTPAASALYQAREEVRALSGDTLDPPVPESTPEPTPEEVPAPEEVPVEPQQ